MKKVPRKILKTGPFIERRTQDRPAHSKYRRHSDSPPANILDSEAINAGTYEVSSGRLRAFQNRIPCGRIVDHYA